MVLRVLMKKKWEENRGKRFYSEMWRKAEKGACKNPVGLSMFDGPKETVEYMWVNIWCMPDWIVGFCHKTAEIYFLDIQLIN